MKETIDVDVRSAPKYGVFIAMGVSLGIIAALIVVSIPPREDAFTPEYSLTSVFGFFAAFFGITGGMLGAAVAVIIDKVSARKAKRYQVEGYFEAQVRPDAPGVDGPEQEVAEPGARSAETEEPTPDASAAKDSRVTPDAADTPDASGATDARDIPDDPRPEAPGQPRV